MLHSLESTDLYQFIMYRVLLQASHTVEYLQRIQLQINHPVESSATLQITML